MTTFEEKVTTQLGEISAKLENFKEMQDRIEKGLYGDDGQGGLTERVRRIDLANSKAITGISNSITNMKAYWLVALVVGSGVGAVVTLIVEYYGG